MKHYYYAVDEFGDKFRRFVRINEARAFIKSRPGWTIVKELCIIAPTIDWNTFEEALF